MVNICAFCGPAAGLIVSLFNSGVNHDASAYNMKNMPIEGVDEIHCTEGFKGTLRNGAVRIHGTLDTPSMGHKYDVIDEDDRIVIKVYNPNMISAQAIETLVIDFEAPLSAFIEDKAFFIIDKKFKWGADEFTCSF